LDLLVIIVIGLLSIHFRKKSIHLYLVFLIVGILLIGLAVTSISKAYDGKVKILAFKNNRQENGPLTPPPPPRPNKKKKPTDKPTKESRYCCLKN
jgi:hypothetical protein